MTKQTDLFAYFTGRHRGMSHPLEWRAGGKFSNLHPEYLRGVQEGLYEERREREREARLINVELWGAGLRFTWRRGLARRVIDRMEDFLTRNLT
jgi:hypothetical protein